LTTAQDAGNAGDLLDRGDPQRSLYPPLTRLLRVMHAMKNQLSGSDLARERAAHALLFPLVEAGPLRQGALAELVHSDPSTVSRHVALLVDRGLVRRVADAQDGRASRLVATPEGEAALAQLRADRQAVLDRVTAAWSPDDIAQFSQYVDRFVHDMTDHLPAMTASASTPSTEKDR
jgi:DNA-binding MarR family transcriptional regulator